jgi:hypothetical protein
VTRFRSLEYSPYETRRILRDRLRRFLPTERWNLQHPRQRVSLTDESVLKLLLELAIEFQSEEQTSRAVYETAREQQTSAPAFDDLSSLGWIRIVWGRVQAALGIVHDLRGVDEGTRAALRSILAPGNERHFVVDSVSSEESEVTSVVAAMQSAPQDVHHLPCPTPSWVVARLWERAPTYLPRVERLRFWVDRCDLLADCHFAPIAAWDEQTAEAFRDAVFDVLGSDPGLLTWRGLRHRLVARSATLLGRAKSAVEDDVKSLPATHVDRYLWLNGRDAERVNDAFDTCGDLWHLVNFLLADIEAADHAAAPHPVAHRLFELAAERPELLEFITLRVREMPTVLADMLLEPRMAAIACILVVKWTASGGAWERELLDRDDHWARVAAFTDAIAVVTHLVQTQALAPAELAALFSWLHGQATVRPYLSSRRPRVDDQMLREARSELVRLPPETLRVIAEACVTSGQQTGVGSPSFVAALDIMALGMLAEALEPEAFIAPYLQSVRSGTYSLSTVGISNEGAGALVRLAQRAAPERWREFLSPLDIRAMLAKGNEPDANRYTVRDEVARSVRAHVRILSRAIVSWDDTPPSELIDGLLRAVRIGAIAHDEKGRVAAFSAHHEAELSSTDSERPIAVDLGEALVSLGESNRERLLAAILETDEPLVLAQLIVVAPHSQRDRIRDRIIALTPADAGELSSLTDVHARIEALLEAGVAEAAATYIAAERELRTLGRVAGRELAQLRMTMRLAVLRADFGSIASADAPVGLNKNEEAEAERILAFYKALAELLKPGGDFDAAERAFEQLHQSHRDVPAYATNLLAARVSRLLRGNLFARLRGEGAALARYALAEADSAMSRWIGADDEDLAVHACNRACSCSPSDSPSTPTKCWKVLVHRSIGIALLRIPPSRCLAWGASLKPPKSSKKRRFVLANPMISDQPGHRFSMQPRLMSEHRPSRLMIQRAASGKRCSLSDNLTPLGRQMCFVTRRAGSMASHDPHSQCCREHRGARPDDEECAARPV